MNAAIRIFDYRFEVKHLLLLAGCYLLMEGMFAWFFVHDSVITGGYQKVMSLLIYAFMLYNFRHLTRNEQVYIGIFSLIMVKLVLESLAGYNSFFRQFTMFTVLFPVVYMLFIKYTLRRLDLDVLEFLAKFYLFAYIVFMVLYGRDFSFGLDTIEMNDYGPFSGDTRIVHASHIFMMIIPFLFYLDRSIATGKMGFIVLFVLCVAIIVIHQHRSVWSSALIALFFYLIGSTRNRIISGKRIFKVVLGLVVLSAIAWFALSGLFPQLADYINERFAEIFNPSKEGSTGNFRILQRETYFALFLERPLLGWTFQGFEMANPLVDWWPENTGQHFHEGYIEVLFYHGLIGLLFKYSVLIYLLIKAFSKKLSVQSVILIAFGISGLVFSLNYVPPLIFWGHIGACLYYIEKDKA